MTTDELIKNLIRDYLDESYSGLMWQETYEKYIRRVYPLKHNVWSVALNDETRDVRYVYLDLEAFEVKPEQVLRTEYVRV